jgi:hypothetical protein
MHQNIEQTAHLMGNSPDMIHRHYKALVTKEEAEKFWGLRPSPRDTSGSDSTI